MTFAPARVALLALVTVTGASCKRGAVTAAPSCLANAACPADQYCAFTPGLCGRGPAPGVCRPRPPSCAATSSPVCGCDGVVYDSECAAHVAGVDLAVMGGCQATLKDWAPCGPRFCDVRTSYCEIYLSDVFEIPTTYNCRPLPDACRPTTDGGAPTCDCFPASTPCRAFCGPLPTGGLTGFHLTCQGIKEPRAPSVP